MGGRRPRAISTSTPSGGGMGLQSPRTPRTASHHRGTATHGVLYTGVFGNASLRVSVSSMAVFNNVMRHVIPMQPRVGYYPY